MAYAILRVQKLKTMGDIGGSLSHNYRNRLTLNADSDRTHLNNHDLDTNEKCMTAIRDRIPEKRRKDAVLCIEHLITASPEWDGWGDPKREKIFFERSRKWLENKYGKNNLISTSIHRDETTPHLVAYVVPIDEITGNLNAKKFIGGTRNVLSEMQTNFAKTVSDLGLDRGREKSLAKHNSIKNYYATVNTNIDEATRRKNEVDVDIELNIPQKSFFESFESYEPKLHAAINASFDEYKRKQKKLIDDMYSQYLRLQSENNALRDKYNKLIAKTMSFSEFLNVADANEINKTKDFLRERTIELTKDREIAAQFKIEMTKIREKALSENTPPSLHPDLKEVTRLQELQDKAFLEDDGTSFKKAVARKYEILGSVGRDLRFSDDVKRVMEYDKATTQSNFIDKNLIVAAENNRYTGKRSAISQNFEPEHKKQNTNDFER